MSKKTDGGRKRTELDGKYLRSIAGMLRKYAEKYEQAAEVIEKFQRPLYATGIDSLNNRTLKELRGNAGEIQKLAEEIEDEMIISESLADFRRSRPENES